MSRMKIIRPGQQPTPREAIEHNVSALIEDVGNIWKAIHQLGIVMDGLINLAGRDKVQVEVDKVVEALKEMGANAENQVQRPGQGQGSAEGASVGTPEGAPGGEASGPQGGEATNG